VFSSILRGFDQWLMLLTAKVLAGYHQQYVWFTLIYDTPNEKTIMIHDSL
jgi:hypothetical protein